jgi:hypothetical protein
LETLWGPPVGVLWVRLGVKFEAYMSRNDGP